MFNLHLSVDQEKREQQGLEARDIEAGLNTDKHSRGYFEGYIGMKPAHPEDYIYWSGYEVGIREYWANKLGVEIPTEF